MYEKKKLNFFFSSFHLSNFGITLNTQNRNNYSDTITNNSTQMLNCSEYSNITKTTNNQTKKNKKNASSKAIIQEESNVFNWNNKNRCGI